MQVVSNNDVLREFSVTFDLVGLQNLVQIFTDRFVLDIAENERALSDLEIGRTFLCHALGFVVYVDALGHLVRNCLQEGLERCPICVFGLLVD
jgi:hypothetical protein